MSSCNKLSREEVGWGRVSRQITLFFFPNVAGCQSCSAAVDKRAAPVGMQVRQPHQRSVDRVIDDETFIRDFNRSPAAVSLPSLALKATPTRNLTLNQTDVDGTLSNLQSDLRKP